MGQSQRLVYSGSMFTDKTLEDAVEKIGSAYREGKEISLSKDEVEYVQKAYRKERMLAEIRTHILVETISGNYWDPSEVNPCMIVEGLCTNRHHKNPIIVDKDLSKEHYGVMFETDEELTDFVVGEHTELQNCRTHKSPIEIEQSFLVYTPYELIMKIIKERLSFKDYADQIKEIESDVLGIISRIKSAGGLADKFTDIILNVYEKFPDKIANLDKGKVYDLGGIRIIAANEDRCLNVLDYLKKRKDIEITPKDYINNPKESGFMAINLPTVYSGLYHELQIMPTQTYDIDKSCPVGGHETYKKSIREAREEIGEEWFELNRTLRDLFGLKPYPYLGYKEGAK